MTAEERPARHRGSITISADRLLHLRKTKMSLYLRLVTLLFLAVMTSCIESDGLSDSNENQGETAAEREMIIVPTADRVKVQPATSAPTVDDPSQAEEPTEAAEPTMRPTSTPVVVQEDLSIRASDISLYPRPYVYTGDWVSIRIDPDIPAGLPPNDVDIRIFIDGDQVVSDNINWRSLNGSPFGLYQWVWNVGDQPGQHNIIVFLDPEDLVRKGDESPDNNVASVTVNVLSASGSTEAGNPPRWLSIQNNCCLVHMISGSAADRDQSTLLEMIDFAFQQAADKLSEDVGESYQVFLVDRVYGQGGYSQDAMVVSYLDRDYVAGGLEELLIHEAVHLIDKNVTSEPITFLSEGLAVWAAGGHYEKQDFQGRMAALVEIGRYRPLEQAIDDFFGTQHEIGYLEGAGFIDYLVQTYGWDRVKAFYAETSPGDGDTLSEAVDANLRRSFNLSLEQIEDEWRASLRALPRDVNVMEDLRLSLQFYDVIRRYQSVYDPTAYYLETWLPDPLQAERVGATADFSRKPESPVNIALEALLHSAGTALQNGDYDKTRALLESVTRVLNNNGAFLDPLSLSYLNLVLTSRDMGYQLQQIELDGTRATIRGTLPEDPTLVQFTLELDEGRQWILAR